jgi:hypothetical protein
VGAIYEFDEPVDTRSIFTYAHALRRCVDRHPHLSITVANAETESPYYAFCPILNLSQHVQFIENVDDSDEGEVKMIERVLPGILDAELPAAICPWKIVILPFSAKKCFVAFSFSHTLGDGVTGIAFHRTFLDSLQEQVLEEDLICRPTLKQLKPAFDTPENLPISWSFLLSPLLGAYLPKPIASFFGFRAAVGTCTPGTWTASSVFYSPGMCRTGVEILSIDVKTVDDTLKICRMHGAKLTGLIHQFIINALSELLQEGHKVDNFTAGTAINLRHAVSVSNDEMGLFVSGDYTTHKLRETNTDKYGEFSWASAKSITDALAVGSKELHDQATGLLRYLTSIRSWTLSKLGQRRDCSYEISNLLSFRPIRPVSKCSVTDMIFCQPTNVTSGPLVFNVVSAVNGPLNITVNWQVGALDVGSHKAEIEFVSSLCESIKCSFAALTSNKQ